MPVALYNVAFDCAEPYELGQFWSGVFDQPLDDDSGPGDDEVSITLHTGPNLYFQRVPEPKTLKNRGVPTPGRGQGPRGPAPPNARGAARRGHARPSRPRMGHRRRPGR
jgi:hypothetical protein